MDQELTQTEEDRPKIMTLGLALVFAFAAGISIGNLYLSQPLFAQIGATFSITTADAGFVYTAGQVGYAFGLLLLVPLGDGVSPRKLIGVVLALTASALFLCSVVTAFPLLIASFVLLGFTTVTGQIVLPLTGDLSPDASRGRFVSVVTSGVLSGLLISRILSGLVANVLGWRAVYIGAALLNLGLLLVLMMRMPPLKTKAPFNYGKTLSSVVSTAFHTPTLGFLLAFNGLSFMAFTLYWTSLTFLLSAPPFEFNTLQIGMISLAGLSAVLASPIIGRLIDRNFAVQAIGVVIAIGIVGSVVALCGVQGWIWQVIAGALVSLNWQGTSILDQTRLFSLIPGARSRLNTVLMVCTFILGITGSSLASLLWSWGGWSAVCGTAIGVGALAGLIWLVYRRRYS